MPTVGVTLAINLPPFLLGPFAGVLVDRYPRKWVMVFMGLLLLFMRNQAVSIGGIYLIVAGLAVATTFYEPARRAIVPALVAKTTLVRANSWLMTSNQATLSLGYTFGGLLFLAIGFRAVVSLDLLTLCFAAVAVAFISVSEQVREASTDLERPLSLQQMKDGWTYLKAHLRLKVVDCRSPADCGTIT